LALTLLPAPWFTGLDDDGNPVSGGLLHTQEAGGAALKVTYSDSAGTPNANPVVLDAAGRATVYLALGAYKFRLETALGVLVREQDNVLGYKDTSTGDLDVTGTAGEDLTAGQCIYLSDGDGSRNAGQWYKADTDLLYSRMLEVGFAVEAITAGETGAIRVRGIVTGLSGLVAGTKYYVSATAGGVSTTKGGRQVGVGLSTTTLLCGAPEPAGATIADLLSEFFSAGGTAKPIDGAYVSTAGYGTLYTVPASTAALVRRITLTNPTGTARLCQLQLIPDGGSSDPAYHIFDDTIYPGERVDLEGPFMLAASATIQAQAAAASAIAARIDLVEFASQPDGFTFIVDDGSLVTDAWQSFLVAAGARTIVPAITLCNTDSSARQVFVEVVPSGGSQGAAQTVVPVTLQAGETLIVPGPVMDAGDMVRAYCATTNVVSIRVSAIQEN